MRPFIVIGDRTDHGGVVIGSAMTTVRMANAWLAWAIRSLVRRRGTAAPRSS